MRNTRGRYIQSGNFEEDLYRNESELYIAKETPGSARDRMRDIPFSDPNAPTPEPVDFAAKNGSTMQVKQRAGFLDIIIREYRRDRFAAILCVFLFMVAIAMGAVWMQKSMQVREARLSINSWRNSTAQLISENQRLSEELKIARDEKRIRNLAQNSLGMLRPERADVQEIYIQMPDDYGTSRSNVAEEPKFELLDFVLSILSLLHIGE